jgi:hypothetical protein
MYDKTLEPLMSPMFEFSNIIDIDPYEELVHSIPLQERGAILDELESNEIIERANTLRDDLASNKLMKLDPSESRLILLAALRNLKYKQITPAQLASLHLFDSALHTLYLNPAVYLIHDMLNNEDVMYRKCRVLPVVNKEDMPTSVIQLPYEVLPCPPNILIERLPERMQVPLIYRFFNFVLIEWDFFCTEMSRAPTSEQYFQVLTAPVEGCWSSIISHIQHDLKCMQVLDWFIETSTGLKIENIMIVPTFTMFQVAINAKAFVLNRQSVQLLPTYGYVESERYQKLKASGAIPLSLYLPEKDVDLQYSYDKGSFRMEVDGHPKETAFAGAIHDVYHALRELSMSESVAKARWRLVSIAQKHPKNQITPGAGAIDEILIDGELIFSYPVKRDSIFRPEFRPFYPEKFGDLFYVSHLKGNLHEDLKYAFIKDMVLNENLWRDSFNIGRKDLRKKERDLFDKLKTPDTKKRNFSSAEALNRFGLLANNNPVSDSKKFRCDTPRPPV